MTRRSWRELENEIEALEPDASALGRPFTDAERERFAADGVDVEAWSETQRRRAVFRALTEATPEAR